MVSIPHITHPICGIYTVYYNAKRVIIRFSALSYFEMDSDSCSQVRNGA